jgi:hypothetical protein
VIFRYLICSIFTPPVSTDGIFKKTETGQMYTKEEQQQIEAEIQAEYSRINGMPEKDVRLLLAETIVNQKWLQKSIEKVVEVAGFVMELQSDTVHTVNKIIRKEPVSEIMIGGSPEEVEALKSQMNK